MAGPYTCHSSHFNLLLGSEDELARGPLGAPTKGSNTLTLFPVVFCTQTPALGLASAPSFTKELC
ncbi:hypothetical protein CK516_32760 [Nostoc sp. 'Peltigera malacea cyanobiont' DB3992]|nr:hypothetical protein CK516_32760 [Nostoc sp. 'Peltigera malacea cyanobiont' DB3992]